MCLLYKARASVLETEESEKGLSWERLEFSSKAMVQTINRQIHKPCRKPEELFLKKVQNTFAGRTESPGPKGTASRL